LPDGTGYKLRVSSTNPVITGIASVATLPFTTVPPHKSSQVYLPPTAAKPGPIHYQQPPAAPGTGSLPMALKQPEAQPTAEIFNGLQAMQVR